MRLLSCVIFPLLYLCFKRGCGYFLLFKRLLCTCNKGKSGVDFGGRQFLRQQKPATPLQKPIMRFSKVAYNIKADSVVKLIRSTHQRSIDDQGKSLIEMDNSVYEVSLAKGITFTDFCIGVDHVNCSIIYFKPLTKMSHLLLVLETFHLCCPFYVSYPFGCSSWFSRTSVC